MSEISLRLSRCFSAVFPQLPTREIPLAAPNAVEEWDSIASITLVSVVEEEFGIQVEPDDIEHFVSFEAVLGYLEKRQVL
jgi:acyl carrier protein